MKNDIALLIIGHIIGDFFLQLKIMSDNKDKMNLNGIWWCSLHVFIYTTTFCLISGNITDIYIFLGIFIPHWIIDKFSLAKHWMYITGMLKRATDADPLQKAFGAIIYVVIDQTLHFISIYVLFHLLNK